MFLYCLNFIVLLSIASHDEFDDPPNVICIPKTLFSIYLSMMRNQKEKRILFIVIATLYFIVMMLCSGLLGLVLFGYTSISTLILSWIVLDAFIFAILSVAYVFDTCVNSLKTGDTESSELLGMCGSWCGSIKDEPNQECCCCTFLLNCSAMACVLLASMCKAMYWKIGSKLVIKNAVEQLKTILKIFKKRKHHKKDDGDRMDPPKVVVMHKNDSDSKGEGESDTIVPLNE